MKIAILTPEYLEHGGGIATYYRHLASALTSQGVQVRVAAGSHFVDPAYAGVRMIDGVQVSHMQLEGFDEWRRKFAHLNPMPVLRDALAAAWAKWAQCEAEFEGYVVEHCDFGLSFIPAMLNGGGPHIMQMHGSMGQIGLYERISGTECDAATALGIEAAFGACAVSVQTYSDMNAGYWREATGRAVEVLLPAWAPPPQGGPVEATADIVVAGRLQSWKGPHILCEALRLLGPKAPKVRWYGRDMPFGHGEGRTSKYLERTYPEIWGSRFERLDPVSPAQLAELQRQALLCLVPSTWDVFNFTVVEAMASERPVICSASAGASSLIVDGSTGFVYGENSPAALAAAIERALACSPQALTRIGRDARDVVVRALDPVKVARERIARYEAAAASTAAPPEPAEWVRALARPRDGEAGDDAFDFLNFHPMKSLMRYAARRTLGKLHKP